MLGQTVLALDLEVRARGPGHPVEEDRLLDRRHERMADPPEQRVVGPDRELVLAALGEPARVVGEVALGVPGVDSERGGHCRVHAPTAGRDLLGRDQRIGRRMLAVLVEQPDGVEDLHRMVRVEAGEDLRDRAEVAVEELAEAAIVVDRPIARAPRDEQLEVRDAERVLHVHGEQADAQLVSGGGPHGMPSRPRGRLAGPLLVRHTPDLANTARVEMCRQRQLLHGCAESKRRSLPRLGCPSAGHSAFPPPTRVAAPHAARVTAAEPAGTESRAHTARACAARPATGSRAARSRPRSGSSAVDLS